MTFEEFKSAIEKLALEYEKTNKATPVILRITLTDVPYDTNDPIKEYFWTGSIFEKYY